LASLDAASVDSSRINCRSDYVVARLDSQNGLMARGERVVEFLGLEPMCFGEAGGGQQQRNEWLHYGTSPIRYTEVRRTRSGAGQFRVTPTHPFPADPMRVSRQPPGKCRRVSKPGQKDIVSAENGTVRFDERGVKRSMMG
jgi:hypothetical protein